MAIIFAVSFLMLWIRHDITRLIPWSIVIGGLVGIAFKLFSDAVRKEYEPGKSKKNSVGENQEKKSETIAPSVRHRAPESVHGQRGGSPLQANAHRPVTDLNCVAARRGGKQRKVNDQSAG
jgi:hypothetical protein